VSIKIRKNIEFYYKTTCLSNNWSTWKF